MTSDAILVGDSALLLTLEPRIDAAINARVVAIADAVRRASVPGVRDVVPTYHSVAVHFDPRKVQLEDLHAAIAAAARATEAIPIEQRPAIDVPVVYGGENGPDLTEVASMVGLSEAEVIQRHAGVSYRVFMLGFAPGFPYLGPLDETLDVPRLETPRTWVDAGSVAIAGHQTGIYPRESPGGWRIIGRTDVELFDETRDPPARFAAGDTVRFIPVERVAEAKPIYVTEPVTPAGQRTITVLRSGLLTTVQDLGRWGHQHFGVPVAGAMDEVSLRRANLLIDNPEDAAGLEVTLLGPILRFETTTTLAICGANLVPTLDDERVKLNTPLRARAGAVLKFGERKSGTRAYIACDGGIDVPMVLGSRSTHMGSGLGGFGGRALKTGDHIPLGERHYPRAPRTVEEEGDRKFVWRRVLRVLPGPQADLFPPATMEQFMELRFTVSRDSNRMGYRLRGTRPLSGMPEAEMISDAVFAGSVQVLPTGELVLLMADRQPTGGYPQIATVITADLPDAGQLGPGDTVGFAWTTIETAMAALIAREGDLLGSQ